MLDLLKAPINQRGGGLVNMPFDRVQLGLNRNIKMIHDYYRNNPAYIKSNHFLVKLLMGLNISYLLEDLVYVGKVEDWSLNFSMALKMTSAAYRGKLFRPGHFYGPLVDEVIISDTDKFDVDHASKTWFDLQPIRVLSHPFTDMDMALPNGKSHRDEGGIAVIAINIPMLALQYKCWRRQDRERINETPQTVMQFLHEFPIPNMVESQTNIAMLNRAMTMFFDGTLPSKKRAHPMYLTDWSMEVDKAIQYWFRFVGRRNLRFTDILSSFPHVGTRDILDTLKLPDEAFTIQIQWAVIMARLAVTTFLVQFDYELNRQINQGQLNILRRWLDLIELNRGLRQALPTDVYDQVEYIIQNGIRPYLNYPNEEYKYPT